MNKIIRKKKIKITASLMCANQTRLLEEALLLEEAGIDGFHIDIMDGHFVPNFGLSIDVLKPMKKATQKFIDVHLMVEYPEFFLERILDTGVEKISFNIESRFNLKNILKLFDKYECDLGFAINPATPMKRLLPEFFEAADYFLILTVNPGFPGQPIIPSVLEKVRSLTSISEFQVRNTDLMIDGHINKEVIYDYWEVGASIFVGGSTGLFCGNHDYKKNIQMLKNSCGRS